MARSPREPRDESEESVTITDLSGREGQVPVRGEQSVQDTMPLFLDALLAADSKKPETPQENAAEETQVIAPVTAGELTGPEPEPARKRPRAAVLAACALVPLGIVAGLAYGLHDDEDGGSADAVVQQPVPLPPSTPSSTPDSAVTATMPGTTAPPPAPQKQRTTERKEPSKTPSSVPPPTSASPVPDPMQEAISSFQRAVESRMKDWPRRQHDWPHG